ncbi:MAG: DUF1295 domain-containing protein, partial [Opitutaceae bacterium]
MSAGLLLTIAFGASCVGFAALYFAARRIGNYGIVDIAWSYAFGLLAVFYALAADGWAVRRVLIAGMVAAWSLRLGTHLAIRVAQHHPVEDTRYVQLRRDWSASFG